MVYTGIFTLFLLCFACSTHQGAAIENVTTNENLRKKWNAKQDKNTIAGAGIVY